MNTKISAGMTPAGAAAARSIKSAMENKSMHHVAIMNKSWNLIPKIISGEKSIESRWYQTKRTPWDKIKAGDKIFFKNSGEAIIA